MRTLIALCLLIVLIASTAHAAGTINLPAAAYCATSLEADGWRGVTTGACVAPPTVGTCAATIQTPNGQRSLVSTASVKYGVAGAGVRSARLAEHDNVWGYNDALPASAQKPWPGVSGSSPYFSMSRTGYFGAHFRTGQPQIGGYFTYGNYGGSIPLSISISRACGDFAGTTGCYVHNLPSADGRVLNWMFGAGVSPYRCYLQPNTDYYLNVMFTDPRPTNPLLAQKCAAGSAACPILLKSMGHQ